jgi:pyrophosphate--fructose-6-phosphate 1-phosphotransferase
MLGVEKVLVQKSDYFARSASANPADFALIDRCVEHSVGCALRRESGVVGEDEGRGNELRAIEFNRIKGGKPFATNAAWCDEVLRVIAQPKSAPVAAAPH